MEDIGVSTNFMRNLTALSVARRGFRMRVRERRLLRMQDGHNVTSKAARGLDWGFASRFRVFAAVEFVLVVEEGVHELAEWIVRGGSFG